MRRRTALAEDDSPGLMRGFKYDATQFGLSVLLGRRTALKAQARKTADKA
jgi:hypothetical protein